MLLKNYTIPEITVPNEYSGLFVEETEKGKPGKFSKNKQLML